MPLPVPGRAVPRYVLYGEPARTADPGFLHMEPLAARSALHGWEIAPHRHDGLHQLFWVRAGGGTAWLDQTRHDFAGPALVIAPPETVHAFAWSTQSEGWVLTLAQGYLARIGQDCEPEVAAAFNAGRVLPAAAQAPAIEAALAGLDEELRYGAPCMATAAAALVRLLLVATARLAPAETEPTPPGGAIWQRWRAALEAGFRTHHAVAEIAAPLAVTRGRLDTICRRHAGRSAQQMLHDRIVLEAQRDLLYTGLTVAEIAHDLGFADPAYFSRFFLRETGATPGTYRRNRGS